MTSSAPSTSRSLEVLGFVCEAGGSQAGPGGGQEHGGGEETLRGEKRQETETKLEKAKQKMDEKKSTEDFLVYLTRKGKDADRRAMGGLLTSQDWVSGKWGRCKKAWLKTRTQASCWTNEVDLTKLVAPPHFQALLAQHSFVGG